MNEQENKYARQGENAGPTDQNEVPSAPAGVERRGFDRLGFDRLPNRANPLCCGAVSPQHFVPLAHSPLRLAPEANYNSYSDTKLF
jgi:hypothetical protein